MADPLSAIASIVGIDAAAASLANTVYKFSDDISNARIQMHDVASEMIQLSNILNTLYAVLRQGQGTYKPQILADSKSILDRVEKIQQEIHKIVKRNSGFRARVKGALSSGKVAELLDRIEAMKSSLGIVLAMYHYWK
jgi:translation initiation factor 2B subunit (eIF-2B alpha/beta/delta family)